MIRCFFTGVQCEMSDAFVLNRRAARGLLDHLKDRIASLQHAVQNLAPLDEDKPDACWPTPTRARHGIKKHRFVCKTVAVAMGSGFPEIDLFMTWGDYQRQAHAAASKGLRDHPVSGKAATGMKDATLLHAEKKGKHVLHLLDCQRVLSVNTRQAIALGTAVRFHERSAADIAALICESAASNQNPESLGLTRAQFDEVRLLKRVARMAVSTEQAQERGPVAP